MTRILFLCTGNSCRSQMAEGWGRALGEGVIEVQSAGIVAHGKNPKAIASMARAGVDISGQESTQLTDEMLEWADLVISVCGHADANCPVLPAHVQKRHIPFDDPPKAQGSEAEIEAVFDRVREQIRACVQGLVEEFRGE